MNKKVEEKEGEIKTSNLSSFLNIRDKLYTMLNKIYLYNLVKKTSAKLVLIIVNLDIEEYSQRVFDTSRLREWFSPALRKGLLGIQEITLTELVLENNALFKNNQ